MIRWIVATVLFLTVNLFAQSITGQINKDTAWSGTVTLTGDVTINSGVTLVIRPGTKIVMQPKSDDAAAGEQADRIEITVLGKLLADGQPGESQITFTSAATTAQPHDWYGIIFKSRGEASLLRNVIVEYAYNGITCFGSSPVIENTNIRKNYYAGINCVVRAKPLIKNSIIISNGFAGINCELGASPIVENTVITQNKNGVVIYDKANPDLGKNDAAAGESEGGNHLFNNTEYNIYNRSQNNIFAQNNFWNTASVSDILQTLFDQNSNPQFGLIDFVPLQDANGQNNDTANAQPAPVEQPTQQPTTATQPPANTATQNTSTQNTNPQNTNPQNTPTQPVANRPAQTPQPAQIDSALIDTQLDTSETTVDSTLIDTPATTEVTEVEKKEPEKPAEPQVTGPIMESFLDGGRRDYLRKVTPIYPRSYRNTGVEGTVLLEVLVGIDGRVERTRVLRSDAEAFSTAAENAVKDYRYKPGTFKGKPISFKIIERFEFKLNR